MMQKNEDTDILDVILDIPEETQSLEFKRLDWPKVVAKIIQTVVAMANTEWWSIVLWVDDPEKTSKKWRSRIYGIEENDDIYDEIRRRIQDIIPPVVWYFDPLLIQDENINRTVAIIKIPKALKWFCSINKEVYQRGKKWNIKLTPHEIIKLSYAKWFEKADRELVDVDIELLNTKYFADWKKSRNFDSEEITEILYKTWLARKDESSMIMPTRAAVLLFAEYPTNLIDTKCTIRVYKYKWTIKDFRASPNLVWKPKTIDWPIIHLIQKAHEYVLWLLESWIEIHSWFITQYKIPQRPIKEAITNAVIHRDYHIKRDIEIMVFEDRVEILSPWLLIWNITIKNIWKVRADEYRNDILVKHLREFPVPPNLDRNEWVEAMIHDMEDKNLYPPLFFTYPHHSDSFEVVLLNRNQQSEWDKIQKYLNQHTYINNEKAREITWITQNYQMSKLLSEWVWNGIIVKVWNNRGTKYKLSNSEDF